MNGPDWRRLAIRTVGVSLTSFLLFSVLDVLAPGLQEASVFIVNPLLPLYSGDLAIVLVLVLPAAAALTGVVTGESAWGYVVVFGVSFGGLLVEYSSEMICCQETFLPFRLGGYSQLSVFAAVAAAMFLASLIIASTLGSLGVLPGWYLSNRSV